MLRIALVVMMGLATVSCSDKLGWKRRERPMPIDADAAPAVVAVSPPFPDGVTAKCLSKEEDDGLTWITFLMNDESPVPVVAPDDGTVGIAADHPHTIRIAGVDASIFLLRNVQSTSVHVGEEVVKGEPLGFAGSSDYFGAEVSIAVDPLHEDAIVVWRIADLSTGVSRASTTADFVCGYREGHLYGSGNAPSYNHPRGTLIKRRGEGTVYEVRNGTRREVRGDLSACAALEMLPLIQVGPAEMNCLKEWEDPIPAERLCAELAVPATGSLVHLPRQESAFVVSDDTLRPIADQNTFKVLGYERAMVRETPESTLEIMRADLTHPFTLLDARTCVSGEPFPEAPL